jgi:hypothetical protein
MVAVQPVSLRPMIEVATSGIPGGVEMVTQEIKKLTSFDLDELSPLGYARDVTVPTLVAQVRHDSAAGSSAT